MYGYMAKNVYKGDTADLPSTHPEILVGKGYTAPQQSGRFFRRSTKVLLPAQDFATVPVV